MNKKERFNEVMEKSNLATGIKLDSKYIIKSVDSNMEQPGRFSMNDPYNIKKQKALRFLVNKFAEDKLNS